MKSSDMKSSHMMLCGLLLVVAVVLVASGVGSYVFLPRGPRRRHASMRPSGT